MIYYMFMPFFGKKNRYSFSKISVEIQGVFAPPIFRYSPPSIFCYKYLQILRLEKTIQKRL